MAVVKRSVSLDRDLLAEVTERVGAGAVSATVNRALADLLRRERGLAAVAEWEGEHGPLSDLDLAEADRILDAAGLPDRRAQ